MSRNIPSRTSNKLQGPRPAALQVSKSSSKIIKKPAARIRSPVVIYLVSPKIIHVRPEEFMGLVQRLTGKQAASSSEASSCTAVVEDKGISACEGNCADDQVALSSPSSNLAAAYPSLCIDIYADWNEF